MIPTREQLKSKDGREITLISFKLNNSLSFNLIYLAFTTHQDPLKNSLFLWACFKQPLPESRQGKFGLFKNSLETVRTGNIINPQKNNSTEFLNTLQKYDKEIRGNALKNKELPESYYDVNILLDDSKLSKEYEELELAVQQEIRTYHALSPTP